MFGVSLNRLAYLTAFFFTAAGGSVLVISPPSLVIEYGAPASANCSTNVTHNGMGWESPLEGVNMQTVQLLPWTVKSLNLWDIEPQCYLNLQTSQELENLPITVYKLPDEVTISIVNHTGPLSVGKTYTLQCNIKNVAPAQNLTLTWFKQNSSLKHNSFSDSTKLPTSKSDILQIQPHKDDNNAIYMCVVELKLGLKSIPKTMSNQLRMNVHYKPEFLESVEIIYMTDSDLVLNCTVMANPPPEYIWSSTNLNKDTQYTSYNLSVSFSSGNYTCKATNQYGNATKVFIIRGNNNQTTFWAILGTGVAVAIALILAYVINEIRKSKSAPNSVI